MNSTAGIFILIAVLIAAVIGVVFLLLINKQGPTLNMQRYQTRWLEIENSVSRDTASSWQLAIMDADKLLDQALREKHYRGKTMGERLKSANNVWKNRDHVWGAHKIRNQLAHDVGASVTYEITLRSLSAYKQALKDLRAI